MSQQRGKIVSGIKKTFPSLSRILGMRDSSESDQDVVGNQLDSTAEADASQRDNGLLEDNDHQDNGGIDQVGADNSQQIRVNSASHPQHVQDGQTVKRDDVREPTIIIHSIKPTKSTSEMVNPSVVITALELQSILRKHQKRASMEELNQSFNETDYFIDFAPETKHKSLTGCRFGSIDEAIAHLTSNRIGMEVNQVREYQVQTDRPTWMGHTQQSQGGRQTRSSSEAIGNINDVMLQQHRKPPATKSRKAKSQDVIPQSPKPDKEEVTMLQRRSQKTQRTPPPRRAEPESGTTSQSEGPREPVFVVNHLVAGDGGATSEPTSTSSAPFEIYRDVTIATNEVESVGTSDQEETIAYMLATATKAKEKRRLRKSLSKIQRTNEKGRLQQQTPLTSTAISRTQPELQRRRSDAFNHATQIEEHTLNFGDEQDPPEASEDVQVVKTITHQRGDQRSPRKPPGMIDGSDEEEEQLRKIQKVTVSAVVHAGVPSQSAPNKNQSPIPTSSKNLGKESLGFKPIYMGNGTDKDRQMLNKFWQQKEREQIEKPLINQIKEIQILAVKANEGRERAERVKEALAAKVVQLEAQVADKDDTVVVQNLKAQVRSLIKEVDEQERYHLDLRNHQKRLEHQIQQHDHSQKEFAATRQPMVTFNDDVREHSARGEPSGSRSDMDVSRPLSEATSLPTVRGYSNITTGSQLFDGVSNSRTQERLQGTGKETNVSEIVNPPSVNPPSVGGGINSWDAVFPEGTNFIDGDSKKDTS